MRARLRVVCFAGLVAVLGALAATAFGATTSWGNAIATPGVAGPRASLSSISCVSAGNCAASGFFWKGNAFVVNERGGVWGNRIDLPYGRVENYLNSISCAAVYSCVAVGTYVNDDPSNRLNEFRDHAFVVNERHGVWEGAMDLPGMKRIDHGTVSLWTISCPKPGFCAAGGTYGDGAGHQVQVFLVNEKNGVWRKPITVSGLAELNAGGNAMVSTISCANARNCTAGGSYVGKDTYEHPFVVDEKNGVWRTAVEVPGFASLAHDGTGAVNSVSCGGADSCAAVGTYVDANGVRRGFVANRRRGIWRNAIEVPGLAALNVGGNGKHDATVTSLSCATATSCAAAGSYTDLSGSVQAFVVSETRGIWRKATEIPGLAALNVGGDARAYSISCGKAGFCGAGGYYSDGSGNPSYPGRQAFVVTETDGVWDTAIEVPGSAALNTGGPGVAGEAAVYDVSCGEAQSCGAVGSYTGYDFFGPFLTQP